MNYALYLNGVYESVLEEIRAAQSKCPGEVCYLQPYSSSSIVKLAKEPPTPESPITIYMSTTSLLSVVSYRAAIVVWENKSQLSAPRLSELNERIAKYQPDEIEITMTSDNGTPNVNLISVIELEKLETPIPVSSLIKLSDQTPLKPRTRSGGWSYVKPLPDWVGRIPQSAILEELTDQLEAAVGKSLALNTSEREQRLKNAPKLPEVVQTISRSFRRNHDVVAGVLIRAAGKCENCGNDAPFIRATDKTPYLEVHHKVMLADGGEDTIDNAVGVCPNCHRELHFGV